MRTPSHVNPSCLCSCLLFILSAFTESRDDFRPPLRMLIINLDIFKPQAFLIIQSASHSFWYLYDTKKSPMHAKFFKMTSRHFYIFQKSLFNTFLQIWDRCVQLILTNFITKHSYKFEKGLFNTFLHIWEGFVQHILTYLRKVCSTQPADCLFLRVGQNMKTLKNNKSVNYAFLKWHAI